MADSTIPSVHPEDSDDVVIALETARVQEERGDPGGVHHWLQKAAVAARKEGRPNRAGELSRAAARYEAPHSPKKRAKFERQANVQQVLGDSDEFADDTIVESVDTLRKSDQPRDAAKHVLPSGTPVAPGATRNDFPSYPAIRVAVKRSLGGRLEARPLDHGEVATKGEQEALLIPLRPGAKLV